MLAVCDPPPPSKVRQKDKFSLKFSFRFLPGLGYIKDDEGNSFLFGDDVCDDENIPLLMFPLDSILVFKLLKYVSIGCILSLVLFRASSF